MDDLKATNTNSIKNEIIKEVHLEFPAFFTETFKGNNFSDNLIRLNDEIYYVMSYQMSNEAENQRFKTYVFNWDPMTLFYNKIMDYGNLKRLKDNRNLVISDISHICHPEHINLTCNYKYIT